MFRFVGIIFLVMIAAGTACGWYAWQDLHTPIERAPGTVFSLVPGESLRSIAAQLHDLGLLRHPVLFVAWARYKRGDRAVRSGTYRIDRALSPVQLMELLLSGPAREPQWVTIPEGYSAAQVAQVLERKGLGGRDVFECLMADPALLTELNLPGSGFEGYLFPDTYAFERMTPPARILRAMVRRFRQVAEELAGERRRAGLTEVQMVTLASVVEKETGKVDERSLISGVFHNRLRLGMPLQSDPTVIYGLTTFDGDLTRENLRDPSPYNTYQHVGLPPGPIANPGRAALEAAVRPATTSARYFVSRNDGSHEFSASLEEHNRAVHRYQTRPAGKKSATAAQ
jgi:UPF0755 protein